MAVELTVPTIGRSQRSEASCHNETDYSSLKCNLIYTFERECILNGLPWQGYALY